jgi:alpha-tubulin suppressor-like RCC1 family protein
VSRNVPTLISGLSGVIQISSGVYHSVVLRSDSTLYSFGYNFYGQLGLGDTIDRLVPTKITSLNGIIQISVGQYHSLAITNESIAYAFGLNAVSILLIFIF